MPFSRRDQEYTARVIETMHCFLRAVFCRYGALAQTLEPISGGTEIQQGRTYRGTRETLAPALEPGVAARSRYLRLRYQ